LTKKIRKMEERASKAEKKKRGEINLGEKNNPSMALLDLAAVRTLLGITDEGYVDLHEALAEAADATTEGLTRDVFLETAIAHTIGPDASVSDHGSASTVLCTIYDHFKAFAESTDPTAVPGSHKFVDAEDIAVGFQAIVQHGDVDETVDMLFRVFDYDNEGLIEEPEVEAFMKSSELFRNALRVGTDQLPYSEVWTAAKSRALEMLAACNSTIDRTIDKDEFKAYFERLHAAEKEAAAAEEAALVIALDLAAARGADEATGVQATTENTAEEEPAAAPAEGEEIAEVKTATTVRRRRRRRTPAVDSVGEVNAEVTTAAIGDRVGGEGKADALGGNVKADAPLTATIAGPTRSQLRKAARRRIAVGEQARDVQRNPIEHVARQAASRTATAAIYEPPDFSGVITPQELRTAHREHRAKIRAAEEPLAGVALKQHVRAEAKLAQKNYSKAAVFLQALVSSPASMGLQTRSHIASQLAHAYTMMGDDELACGVYRRAMILDPHNGEMSYALGLLLFDRCEYAAGGAALATAALFGCSDVDALTKQTMCWIKSQNYAAAKGCARQVIAHFTAGADGGGDAHDDDWAHALRLMARVDAMEGSPKRKERTRNDTQAAIATEVAEQKFKDEHLRVVEIERLLEKKEKEAEAYKDRLWTQETQLMLAQREVHERQKAVHGLRDEMRTMRSFDMVAQQTLQSGGSAPPPTPPRLVTRLLLHIERGPSNDPTGTCGEVAQLRKMLDDEGVWYSQALDIDEVESFVVRVGSDSTITRIGVATTASVAGKVREMTVVALGDNGLRGLRLLKWSRYGKCNDMTHPARLASASYQEEVFAISTLTHALLIEVRQRSAPGHALSRSGRSPLSRAASIAGIAALRVYGHQGPLSAKFAASPNSTRALSITSPGMVRPSDYIAPQRVGASLTMGQVAFVPDDSNDASAAQLARLQRAVRSPERDYAAMYARITDGASERNKLSTATQELTTRQRQYGRVAGDSYRVTDGTYIGRDGNAYRGASTTDGSDSVARESYASSYPRGSDAWVDDDSRSAAGSLLGPPSSVSSLGPPPSDRSVFSPRGPPPPFVDVAPVAVRGILKMGTPPVAAAVDPERFWAKQNVAVQHHAKLKRSPASRTPVGVSVEETRIIVQYTDIAEPLGFRLRGVQLGRLGKYIVRAERIVQGSTAWQAGLKRGDIIESINNESVAETAVKHVGRRIKYFKRSRNGVFRIAFRRIQYGDEGHSSDEDVGPYPAPQSMSDRVLEKGGVGGGERHSASRSSRQRARILAKRVERLRVAGTSKETAGHPSAAAHAPASVEELRNGGWTKSLTYSKVHRAKNRWKEQEELLARMQLAKTKQQNFEKMQTSTQARRDAAMQRDVLRLMEQTDAARVAATEKSFVLGTVLSDAVRKSAVMIPEKTPAELATMSLAEKRAYVRQRARAERIRLERLRIKPGWGAPHAGSSFAEQLKFIYENFEHSKLSMIDRDLAKFGDGNEASCLAMLRKKHGMPPLPAEPAGGFDPSEERAMGGGATDRIAAFDAYRKLDSEFDADLAEVDAIQLQAAAEEKRVAGVKLLRAADAGVEKEREDKRAAFRQEKPQSGPLPTAAGDAGGGEEGGR